MKAPIHFAALFLACVLLSTSSCKKDKGSAFTLQLKANYGGQNFAIYSPCVDPQGRLIEISAFEFYLSHIYLIKSDSTKVKVSDVALLDFTNPSSLSISVNGIEGEFTGISFVCGLDSLTNDTTNPNNYVAPNPLSYQYNMYWLAWNSYRFEVLEGKWDTAVMPIMRNGLLYHVGLNSAYRQTQINKSFSVCCGKPYTLNLNLDVEKIFFNTSTNETLDIVTQASPPWRHLLKPALLIIFQKPLATDI